MQTTIPHHRPPRGVAPHRETAADWSSPQAKALSEVTHDGLNLVSALELYCDLLAEPGVLTQSFAHYAGELKLVAAASRGLIEKVAALRPGRAATQLHAEITALPGTHTGTLPGSRTLAGVELPFVWVRDLAEEIRRNGTLLEAIAGPAVRIQLHLDRARGAVPVTAEDLTRVLVNLVKNSAEAMERGGDIAIHVREERLPTRRVVMDVEDSGPGIAETLLGTIFEAGYTTRAARPRRGLGGIRSLGHRGLGLAITRAVIEAAGGAIRAENRTQGGARIHIELPVTEA